MAEPYDKQPYGYTVQQAAILATYLVLKAKTHIDGCGGESDTWIIHPSGTMEPKSPTWIYMMEQRMLRMEFQVRKLASAFFDARVSDEEIKGPLDELMKAVKDQHFDFRI